MFSELQIILFFFIVVNNPWNPSHQRDTAVEHRPNTEKRGCICQKEYRCTDGT